MPKRLTRDWLSRAALGLTSGALALSVLAAGGGTAPPAGVRSALADEIDCYNDKDLFNLPECVERRANDRKSGMGQNEAQGATGQSTEASGGNQPSGGGQQQASSGDQGAPAGSGQQQAPSASQQPAPAPAATDEDEDEEEAHVPASNPKQVVLTIGDAGKEATQYLSEEGSDKHGLWARTRYERDRSNGASALGPNVMDSKAWIAKDVEAAKALFKEQAAIKNFPERKESAQGSVEKIKPTAYGEEFTFTSAFYQDDDNKVWQHYRFIMRVGKVVSVVYLFGREEFFQDQKERTWNNQGDWYYKAVYERM